MSSSTNVSNSAGDLNNDFPCMQTNSQRNAPYPLDVHFLLRTQLQKRREYKPIKEDYETSDCHTSVSKKKEEDEDRSCISPCQSTASSLNSDDEDHETEADFENVSKWFPSLTIKYRYVITVRFIDEGIDKTEQLSHKPKETDTI
ncbi:hypothetical protein C9374_000181 [Naegleria lovaniensis]|uniref:Uncharacterized protein n=1 Tax=Naegleria lovaniensis TaxID=51637 RepID=A0AA88GX83_NAELO|nr:uncharacterized protein C9374_000181 [Naegleria lovaniensis]KAG2388742.1 hypothetical protein C9374_000181 [Naegleria lovaniensis]